MKIMLCAGHGYNTPGKRNNTMREWEFNSAVANYAKDVLANYDGVEVLFAHDPTGKVDIDLQKRTDYANRAGVDVYVSIHANAATPSAHGIETFIHPITPAKTKEIAELVHKKLIQKTGRRDRGVKKSDFHVLRETNMSAILVECGFMTNSDEAILLKSAGYRLKCAYAITEALVEYYKLKEKPQPKSAPEEQYSEKVQGLQAWAIENGISDGKNPYAPATLAYVWEVARNVMNKVNK